MALATLTSKGQVTIPKVIRDSLNIKSGDKIEFLVTEGKEALIRPTTMTVDSVFGRLHNFKIKPVSVEKMDAVVKKKIRESFK